MQRIAIAVSCLFLAGCDFTVPLTSVPDTPIDAALVGLWENTAADGQDEQLLILPLNRCEYLVSYPSGAKNAMYARACLCQTAGLTLIQLTWFGTAQGVLPDTPRVYQFASFTRTGDTLSCRLLNADTVSRDVGSSDGLARAILAQKDAPGLFREEMLFKKVPLPEAPGTPPKRPPLPAGWK